MRRLLAIAVVLLSSACGESAAQATDALRDDDAALGDAAPDDAVRDDAAPDDAATGDGTGDTWPEGYWLPTDMAALYGLWVDDDGTTVRALEMAQFDLLDADMKDISPAYRIWRYPSGGSPAIAERGRATLHAGPILHLETVWSDSVADKGKKTDLVLLPAPAASVAVATGSGTPRVFHRATALP